MGAVLLGTTAPESATPPFGTLITVAPLGASPGIAVSITGTGFNTTAANNLVTFTPESGSPQTLAASAVATVDANKDWRRVTVTVPTGLPAVRTALTVTNKGTGGTSGGLSIDVLHLFAPVPNEAASGVTGLPVLLSASNNTRFISGQSLANFGPGTTVRSLEVLSATQLRATVDVAANATAGPRNVVARSTNQSLVLLGGFVVKPPGAANQPPTANPNGPYSGTQDQTVSFTSKGSSDPDNDPLTYAWTFGDGGKSTDANPTHTYTVPGTFDVSLTVSDGKGGSATATTTANIAPAVALTRIDVDPPAIRFSALDATRAVTVTGTKSDNSTVNLTAGGAGTTYGSSNPFVVSVSADGLVTARGNGEAVVTATNGAFSDTVAVVVESGVTLDSLQLTPATTTLKAPGASQSLTLKGTFSDGSVRDLTNAAGTTYGTGAANIASVSPAGLVTAASNGRTDITATHADRSASAEIIVAIPEGRGFVRGAVFDDSRGLPLAGAMVTLLFDGGGTVDPALSTLTDETGRYVLPARGGDALLRIQKDGFTAVERSIVIPASAVTRALDARLTPIDSQPNPLQSAFGGQARDASGAVTFSAQPGTLPSDMDLRITPISAQGLAGRLPLGWSPIGAVDISPAATAFAQTSALLLPNSGGAAAGATLTIAKYDPDAHVWTAVADAQVSQDGRSISTGIASSGQYAALLPDAAPFTPPAQVNGQPLTGVDGVAVPETVTADGETVPRAAAPGDGARAVGRIGVGGPAALPSGTAMQVHVNETFELLDASTVVPLPFTQDMLVHARPRPPSGGALGATFPITPSRSYTIQELMRGVVQLDVTRPSTQVTGAPAGPQGTTVTDVEGDSLVLPGGALAGETVVDLRRTAPPSAGLPSSFVPVQSFAVDIIGTSLLLPARISTAIPAGVTTSDQVLLIQTFIDPLGVRRMRVAGIGRIEGDRLVSDHVLGTLIFPGVRAGGEYSFVKSADPVGFVTGNISGADGSTPAPLALVTSSNTPFVDVTGSTGRYIVVARAATDSTIAVRHLLSSDTATGIANPAARDAIVVLPLTLAVAPPSVVVTSPAAGAVDVALDTSLTIDFSEAIDPASITDASVTLQTGGAGVPVSRTLSQDRRRLTVRPVSPLAGKTTYVLSLTSGVKDLSGAALVAFTPISFTTLDPTKPPQPPPGQIVAELPDADGMVLIIGSAGAAAGNSAVTATNLRTQETTTVLALADGSFRVRLPAIIGDDLTLTLRDDSGRENTISIAELVGADGLTGVGPAGGVITGAGGRIGRLLPRALTQAGTFRIDDATAAPPVALSSPFSYVDRFELAADAAVFNRIASLTLTESQGRLSQTAIVEPFLASGQLTVPADFLVNSAIRFTAVAQDAGGLRRSVTGSTMVVPGSPQTQAAESGTAADFPSLFLTAPAQALQNQVVEARAVAPAARIDLQVPASATSGQLDFLLVRVTPFAGNPRLSVMDRLSAAAANTILATSGREFPGMSRSGEYAIVGSTAALSFVTGELAGPPGIVASSDLPFVFETTAPNGRFILPVFASQAFALQFLNADGTLRGSVSGMAPAGGLADIGSPVAPQGGSLSVSVEPNETAIVDIDGTILLRFSAPVDLRSLGGGLTVTDPAGARVFGALAAGPDNTVTFRPARRWKYGTRYRITLTTGVTAMSGARLGVPFNGSFTTFTPRLLSASPVGFARDVSASAVMALVGTDAGARLIDITAPLSPVAGAQLPNTAGAGGVALISETGLTDRNGQLVAPPIGLVASGTTATGTRVDVFSLQSPSSPAFLGGTRVSGVGTAAVPSAVVADGGGAAFAALGPAGIVSLRPGESIPNDSSNPERAIGARYPSTGSDSIPQVAVLPGRVITAGALAVTSLDAVTLQARGQTPTDRQVTGIAAVPAIQMDLDGDRIISPDSEVIDLAVIAGGTDGTVQFYRIPDTGPPSLLSVIRIANAETTGVVIDTAERLAYVTLGARGVGIIDLDGAVSVQPIDLDRDGVDDRLLGLLDTKGTAARIALAPGRGIGVVANGASGIAVLQLRPARTRFRSVMRDPIAASDGDEEDLLAGGAVLTSDEGMKVVLDVSTAAPASLLLSIEDRPVSGAPRLSFTNGTLSAPLQDGLNSLSLVFDKSVPAAEGTVTLRVATVAGASIASVTVPVRAASASEGAVEALSASPNPITIGAGAVFSQLSVGAVLSDGRMVNVTSHPLTSYAVQDSVIAEISADGIVTAKAGGRTSIQVRHAGLTLQVPLVVDLLPVVVAIETNTPRMTLTSKGQQLPIDLTTRLSDRSFEPLIAGSATFESSNTGIVTVDGSGRVTAVGPGNASITVRVGTITRTIDVFVEFRTPPALTNLTVEVPGAPINSGDGIGTLRAQVSGSGSLEGLSILYEVIDAPLRFEALTDFEGIAVVNLRGLRSPGTFSIRVSVVNPANGQTFVQTTSVQVVPGGVDAEPNDTLAVAPALPNRKRLDGTLGGADARDVFASTSDTPGTLRALVLLTEATDPAGVLLRFLRADGTELSRHTMSGRRSTFSQDVPAGPSFVSLESINGAAIGYSLELSLVQAPITITSAAPLSGSAGTTVVIEGTGFSLNASDTRVTFGGVLGKVVSVTPSRIDVLVPANAIDGPIVVESRSSHATGPTFVAGRTTLPEPTLRETDPANLRFDPATSATVDITRLAITADPIASTAEMQTLIAGVGGTIIGFVPALNLYYVEFAANQTLAGLAALRRQLAASPLVVRAVRDVFAQPAAFRIDTRDGGFTFNAAPSVGVGAAYAMARVFEAIDAIRSTPPFTDPANLTPVRIGILDGGFAPSAAAEFVSNGSPLVTAYRAPGNSGAYSTGLARSDNPIGHGTMVTGVIAAANDGTPMSGVLNSLYAPYEQPRTHTFVFGIANPTSDAWSLVQARIALATLAGLGNIDAVNMSYRFVWPSASEEFEQQRLADRDAFALFGGRTVFVPAAGNDGLDARFTLPAAHAETLDYFVTVGATSVANVDSTGEGADARSIFTFTRSYDQGIECRTGVASSESNCGSALTLSAPGEDMVTTGVTQDYVTPSGTSFAAPIVTSIVGIMQAIRTPGSPFIAPTRIRSLLVDLADDISATWDPGSMRRLNALNVVRALLPTSGNQMVYVADQEVAAGGATGGIVGINVDPLTGQPLTPVGGTSANQVTIPLSFTLGSTSFTGTRPTALAMAPDGAKLYALVRSVSPDLGDGLLVVNTRSNKAEDFLPLSGAAFPPIAVPAGTTAPPAPAKVTLTNLRPGMAFSKDGRLLYVATGLDVTIVNIAEDRIVRTLADLPAAYKALANQQPANALATRKTTLRSAAVTGVAGRPGIAINGLTISPDGKTLYAALSTGGGGGTQPGGILSINVDLYSDQQLDAAGLQSDLARYFTLVSASATPMLGAGQSPGGDEPGAVGVTPNGKHLLLVNGGLNFFESIPPETLNLDKYYVLLVETIAQISASTSLSDLVSRTLDFPTRVSAVYDELLLDMKQQAASGLTLVGAPGFAGVFSAPTSNTPPTQSWLFTTDVNFAWNPSTANGNSIINQFKFRDVFAKRAFDVTVSPTGRRAIVPYYQTGNLGVMDLERQAQFLAPPGSTPRTGITSLSNELFQGVVGVTPAIRFDNNLWPRRGAFYSPGTFDLMPSPDENLLFAWDAEYAQNGKFAVISHTGSGAPRDVTRIVGDFVNDLETRTALVGLDATFSGNSASWTEDDGSVVNVGVNQSVTLKRGGGAISIVNDAAITTAFDQHIGQTAPAPDGTPRPYFSARPIEGAVTSIKRYTPAGAAATAFHRPRGVAIQPFVVIETPRAGDHVTASQPVQITWRDQRVVSARLSLKDPAQVDRFGAATVTVRSFTHTLTSEEVTQRALSIEFGDLFGVQGPLQNRRYRIEVELSTATESLSTYWIDVTFDDLQLPITVDTEALVLSPKLNFFATVSPQGAGKTLTLVHKKGDGQPDEDLSTSGTVQWQSINLGFAETEIPGFGSFKDFLRGKLQQAGVTVPFDLATVEVTSGSLRATSGGVQAVRGCLAGGLCSNPIIVIAGLELDSVEFSPQSIITATVNGAVFAANNLTERFKNLEVNPPMILAADDTAIALDKGLVLLQDVQFKFLGGPGTLGLQDLYDGIGRVLSTAGPLAVKEKVAFEIVKLAVGQLAGLLPFESDDPAIATLSFGDLPGLKNVVQSGGPGITQVTGTLDLSSIGLGDASDSVLVWVLPQIDSAEIEPSLTTVNLTTPAGQRPAITTFARTTLLQNATLFEVPEKYASFAQYVDKVLPASWKTLTTGERTYSVGDNLRISVSFALTLDEGSSRIALRDLKLGFTTPNLFNDYTVETPAIAALDPGALIGTTHTVRPLARGETLVSNHVDLGILGEVDAKKGLIKVCDGQLCDDFTLELQKKLLFMQKGEACSQNLKVLKTNPDGVVEDVTASGDTKYFSLRQLSDSGVSTVLGVNVPALDALVQQAVQKIKDKLSAALGATVPFAHGKVSISDKGAVTVEEDGLEIIWAAHQGRITNFSVVLSGFKLDAIDLQPLSLLTPPVESETGQKLLEKVNEALKTELEPNAPMVLIDADENTDFSFLTRKGGVIIRDAKFKVLGQSEIGVRQVLGAIEDFLSPAVRAIIQAELGSLPGAELSSKGLTSVLFELLEFGIEGAATQLVEFEIEQGEDVATVTNSSLTDLTPAGIVTAQKPGIAVVKGKLKLGGDCGAGEAEDQISVWVLPGIDTLELKPKHTVVTRACQGSTTAKVKSIMCSAPFPDAVLELPEEVATIGEFASRVLPSSLQPPVPGQIPVDKTFTAGDFEFRVKGTIAVNFSDIRLTGLTVCTTVPNGLDQQPGVPGISNEYTFVNPAIGELGGVNPFSVLFRDKGVTGTTDVKNHVEVFAINDNLNADGTFTVVDQPCGDEIVVEKILVDPAPVSGVPAVVDPGDIIRYVIRVGNVGQTASENVQIVDTPTLETPAGALVPGTQPQLLTCVVPDVPPGTAACLIPRLEPGEIIEVDVFVDVPLQGPVDARLCNTAAVNGKSVKICNDTSHSPNLGVSKRLSNAATGAPDPSIDPTGEPVLDPGTTVQYEVTVSNTGSSPRQGITLTDETFHVQTINGQQQRTLLNSYVEQPPFDLDPGDTKVITISVALPPATACRPGDFIENRAVTSAAAAVIRHFMKCVPQLQVEKELIDPPVASGQPIAGTSGPLKNVTYRVTVSNSGSGIAGTVVVSDDARIVGADIDRSLVPPGTSAGCTFVDVLPGAPESCDLRFTFGQEATGNTLVNTARITTPANGPTAQTSHPVVPPTLEITKELVSQAFESGAPGAPALILAGTTVTYRITVKNVGTLPAAGVTLTDLAIAGSLATGTTVRFNQPFNVPALDPDDDFEQEVTFAIPLSDAGRQLLNRASVNVAGVDPVEVRHDIVTSTLAVAKRVIDPAGGVTANLVRGSPVSYELTVTNLGGAPANNVSLLDTASIDGSIIRGPTTIPIGTLAAGASKTTVMSFTIPTLPDPFDPCVPVPGIGCALTIVNPSRLTNLLQVLVGNVSGVLTSTTNDLLNPELKLTKTLVEPVLAAGQTLPGGSTVVYRLIVENTDSITATGVRLTDTATIGNTTLFEQTFELGTLEPGDRREQLVRFTLPIGFVQGTLRNAATVNYRHLRAETSHAFVDPSLVTAKGLLAKASGAIETAGKPTVLIAGASAVYSVSVTNYGKDPSAPFTLTDTPSIERRGADGAITITALANQVLSVPALQPSTTWSATVTVAVPSDSHAAMLVNRLVASIAGVAVSGTQHAIVNPTAAGLLITEMVVDPQQDWNDSGGNGTPFDATPGNGAVDFDDVWVEITRPTNATANWKIVLTDALGETAEQMFGAAPADPAALVKVVSGFGALTLPVIRVEVVDDTGNTRQAIDVRALNANYPIITGPVDEALFWSIYGVPSPVIQQFIRGTATPGVFRPF